MVGAAFRSGWRSAGRGGIPLVIGVVHPVFYFFLLSAYYADEAAVVLRTLHLVAWTAALWGVGAMLRGEAIGGTAYRTLLSSERPAAVLALRAAGVLLRIMATAVVVVGAIALATGTIRQIDAPAAAGSALAILLSGLVAGLVAGVLLLHVRRAPQVSSVLTFAVALLSGLIVPVEEIAGALAPVAAGIGLYWAAETIDAAIGTLDWAAFGWSAVVNGAWFGAYLVLLRWTLGRARATGALLLR